MLNIFENLFTDALSKRKCNSANLSLQEVYANYTHKEHIKIVCLSVCIYNCITYIISRTVENVCLHAIRSLFFIIAPRYDNIHFNTYIYMIYSLTTINIQHCVFVWIKRQCINSQKNSAYMYLLRYFFRSCFISFGYEYSVSLISN